jgi:hypothetical protein
MTVLLTSLAILFFGLAIVAVIYCLLKIHKIKTTPRPIILAPPAKPKQPREANGKFAKKDRWDRYYNDRLVAAQSHSILEKTR